MPSTDAEYFGEQLVKDHLASATGGPDRTLAGRIVVDQVDTMRALQHVLLSVAPVVVASDPNDSEATSAGNTLYLYDSFGGGLRLSQPTFDRFHEVVQLAHDIVAGCARKSGCPSCVMLGRRPEGSRDLSKAGALAVLRLLTAAP